MMCDRDRWLAGVEADPLLKPLAKRVAATAAELADWPIVPSQADVARCYKRGGGTGTSRQYIGKADGWRALVYRGWFTEVSGGVRFTCPGESDG